MIISMMSLTPLLQDDSIFLDIITLTLVAAVLLLSLVSLAFIFHLRFKTSSGSAPHLRNFNSMWALRLLLVFSIVLWALSHLIHRLRLTSLNPLLLCRLHVILSLGLFQPAFLLTLLALLNLSTVHNRSNSPPAALSAATNVLLLSFLLTLLQALTLFGPINNLNLLPAVFRRDKDIHRNPLSGGEYAVCAYPLLSTIVFAAFAFSFLMAFALSCWRVVSVVINKRLRVRIYALGVTTMAGVVIQLAFLALSVVWMPGRLAALLAFLAGLAVAVVGEGILVINPILDALSAGGEVCVLRLGGDSSSSSRS